MVLIFLALPFERNGIRSADTEYRVYWKENIQSALKGRFGQGETADLFSSLLMGTRLPIELKTLFKKTGLLHLVAISGFHFSLLSGYLFILLGFFVRGRGRLYLLLLFLAAYAFFLGALPSVLRAFFATLVALFCLLFDRRSKPLNTFGLSLIATLIFDWKLLYELSFQMSFGITYAILTLYPFLLERCTFPKLEEVRKRSRGMQLFLVVRTLFEKSLLFSIAVSSMAIPISLYAFGAFPLFSVLINLIFTPLFSLLLGGVLLATLFPFLDPIVGFAARELLSLLRLFDVPLPQLQGQCPFYFVVILLSLLTCLPLIQKREVQFTTW